MPTYFESVNCYSDGNQTFLIFQKIKKLCKTFLQNNTNLGCHGSLMENHIFVNTNRNINKLVNREAKSEMCYFRSLKNESNARKWIGIRKSIKFVDRLVSPNGLDSYNYDLVGVKTNETIIQNIYCSIYCINLKFFFIQLLGENCRTYLLTSQFAVANCINYTILFHFKILILQYIWK